MGVSFSVLVYIDPYVPLLRLLTALGSCVSAFHRAVNRRTRPRTLFVPSSSRLLSPRKAIASAFLSSHPLNPSLIRSRSTLRLAFTILGAILPFPPMTHSPLFRSTEQHSRGKILHLMRLLVEGRRERLRFRRIETSCRDRLRARTCVDVR